jgi:hypothetical protein
MAVNVRLIGSYLSDLATATASSTAAGYDVKNAVILDRSSVWKAGGTSSVTLTLDLGSAVSVSAACIANHNGSGWTTPKLRRSSDNVTYTDVAALTSITTGEDYYTTFGAISYRYWRIEIASASAAPQVGIFYLGTATTLTDNPWIGQGNADVYNVERASAQSGAIVAEQWGRRLIQTKMEWGIATTAAKDQLRDFLRTEGGPLRPFWYVPREDATTPTYGRAYLVRMQDGSFQTQEVFGGLHSMGVTLLEEV